MIEVTYRCDSCGAKFIEDDLPNSFNASKNKIQFIEDNKGSATFELCPECYKKFFSEIGKYMLAYKKEKQK